MLIEIKKLAQLAYEAAYNYTYLSTVQLYYIVIVNSTKHREISLRFGTKKSAFEPEGLQSAVCSESSRVPSLVMSCLITGDELPQHETHVLEVSTKLAPQCSHQRS